MYLARENRNICLHESESKSNDSQLTVSELQAEKQECFDNYSNVIEKLQRIERKTHFKGRSINKNPGKKKQSLKLDYSKI